MTLEAEQRAATLDGEWAAVEADASLQPGARLSALAAVVAKLDQAVLEREAALKQADRELTRRSLAAPWQAALREMLGWGLASAAVAFFAASDRWAWSAVAAGLFAVATLGRWALGRRR